MSEVKVTKNVNERKKYERIIKLDNKMDKTKNKHVNI